MQAYIASAGDAHPAGIHRVQIDTQSGDMRLIDTSDAISDCLYLQFHPGLPVLYAVGQGQICAFAVAPDGGLSFINCQPTDGLEPCYVSVSSDGRHALVVNYAGPEGAGSIVVFPLQADGTVDLASQHMRAPGEGAGVHPTRQDAPHPHMILSTPDGEFVLVNDLGTDRVLIFRLSENGTLEAHTQPWIAIQAGSGPRHLVFHPNGRVFYVLSELEPVLSIVSYDPAGRFELLGTVPALMQAPPYQANTGADIHIMPSGRFLYTSNRGYNILSVFRVSPDGLSVEIFGQESTQGNWPRGFSLDPAGDLLIVANQHSDDLYSFHIDPQSGQLKSTGNSLNVSAPVCVLMRPSS